MSSHQQIMNTMTQNPLLEWDKPKTFVQNNLAQLVQLFQVEYAKTGGVVKAIINPLDLMPYTTEAGNADNVPDDVIMSALTPIEFIDNVPTVEGIPVWDRLSGEAIPYFNVFKVYRDLKKVAPTRSLVRTAEMTGISVPVLGCLSKIWQWSYRVTAYDEEMARCVEWERREKAKKLDLTLGDTAASLIQQAACYIEHHDEMLNPKTAIELIKVMAPIARIAVGLPANAPIEEIKSGGGGSGGSGAVNINIANANGNGAQAASVHGMSGAEIAEKTKKQNEDPSHLASILMTLQQSGALERTVLEMEDGAIEPEFEEVEE